MQVVLHNGYKMVVVVVVVVGRLIKTKSNSGKGLADSSNAINR